MQVERLLEEDAQKLEDFICSVNGNDFRDVAKAFLHRMFTKGEFRPPTFLIMKDSGNIIVTASYSEEMFSPNTWGISWVSVHPDWRKQGLGQKIVEECLNGIRKAAGKNATAILTSHPDKAGLYKRCGFEVLGKSHSDSVYMINRLLV